MPRSKKNHYIGYDTPFATRLRELIDAAKIPQTELADYIGVTRQAVSAYSLGTTSPDIEKFALIADYFGVSTEYLLGRTDIKKADASKQATAEYLGLSEEAIDTILGLQCIHFKQNPENDYNLTLKPSEPLPEVFSKWLVKADLPLIMSDIYRMLCSTLIAQDSGWHKENHILNEDLKAAIRDLKEHGYVSLSMTQQVSFFSQSTKETFGRSIDSLISEAIEMVNEENGNGNIRDD